MNKSDFLKQSLSEQQFMNETSIFYITKHNRRLYNTFNFIVAHLKHIPNPRILSVGGYYASLEKVLKEEINAEITVIDFPDTIEMLKPYYDHLGFRYIGVDLSKGLEGVEENYYDLIVYTEVIEHISKSPYDQLVPFDKLLKPGGKIIVTTPNLLSIVHIMKLVMGFPHYADPEAFFAPVSQETLQIHRREYIPKEITSAFDKMNYKSYLKYFIYNEPKSLQYRMMYIIGQIIPKYREGMMIVGEKPV